MLYLLPIGAAILWGVSYAITDYLLGHVSIATMMFIASICGLSISILMSFFIAEGIDFTFIKSNKTFLLFVALIVAGEAAALLTYFAIQYNGATFSAMCEVAYPLFIPIFAYLFFAKVDINAPMVTGAVIVMIGLFVLVYGQVKIQSGHDKDAQKELIVAGQDIDPII